MTLLFAALGTAAALRCGPSAHISRRDALISAAGLLTVGPPAAHASAERPRTGWDPRTDYLIGAEKNAISDYEIVAAQQATGGRLDVNSALVTDYKRLRGMYPHAAGQIASHGPGRSGRGSEGACEVVPGAGRGRGKGKGRGTKR